MKKLNKHTQYEKDIKEISMLQEYTLYVEVKGMKEHGTARERRPTWLESSIDYVKRGDRNLMGKVYWIVWICFARV